MAHSSMRRIAYLLVPIVAVVLIIVVLLVTDPNRVSAIASILAAVTTLFLAIVTWDSTHQANIRDEKARRTLVRPQLIPMNVPTSFRDSSSKVYISKIALNTEHEHLMDIQNVGAGAAYNIWGILLPYAQPTGSIPNQFSMRDPAPLSAGTCKAMTFTEGGTLFNNQDSISGESFSVPEERAPKPDFPNPQDRRDGCVARLTITCMDVLGLKHLTMFDLTQLGEWVYIAVENDIAKDIRDLDTEKGRIY